MENPEKELEDHHIDENDHRTPIDSDDIGAWSSLLSHKPWFGCLIKKMKCETDHQRSFTLEPCYQVSLNPEHSSPDLLARI